MATLDQAVLLVILSVSVVVGLPLMFFILLLFEPSTAHFTHLPEKELTVQQRIMRNIKLAIKRRIGI